MRLLRGLTGLILLAALIGGAPWLFWQLGGDLLPDHVPSPAEAWNALTGPDSGRMFLGALLIVAAIAWAVLVVITVLELAAAVSGRRRRRIRGLAWAQGVAGVLIGMIMVGTVGTGTATAQALPPLSHAQPATAAAESVGAPAAARRLHPAEHRRTAHPPLSPRSLGRPGQWPARGTPCGRSRSRPSEMANASPRSSSSTTAGFRPTAADSPLTARSTRAGC